MYVFTHINFSLSFYTLPTATPKAARMRGTATALTVFKDATMSKTPSALWSTGDSSTL